MSRGFALEDRDWQNWVLPYGSPCQIPVWIKLERQANRWVLFSKTGRIIGHMPDGAVYFEQTYYPLEDGRLPGSSLPDVLAECMWSANNAPPGPIIAQPGGYQVLAEGARRLRQRTDRAIVAIFGGNLLERGQQLYRNDNFYMLLAGEPKKAHAFLDQMVEFHLASLEHYLKAVGPYVDVVGFSDDLGMQNGPQISPRMYREFFKPRHQRMWRRVKEIANVKVMLHSCGSIRAMLPELIDAGLDIVNPVQISAKGMEAEGLKRDFGTQMVFWGGGCDTQQILPNGSPDEIRSHVKQQVRLLAPGGGYIFNQVHNIQAGTPPENIKIMFEAAREYDPLQHA
jgi:uroporphyrinogen decarboxylase